MAIKPPVKTVDEAFNNSCKKNGLSVKRRKRSRKSMSIRDDNDNTYIISDDFSIRKKIKRNLSGKKRNNLLTPKESILPMENIKINPSYKRAKSTTASLKKESSLIKIES